MTDENSSSAPWRKYYNDKAAGLNHAEAFPLTEFLDRAMRQFPTARFLTFNGTSLSYEQTRELVDRLAGGLAALGVEKGDRVGYMAPAHPAFSLTCFALWRLGAVEVGLNPLYAESKLIMMANDSGLSAVITLDSPDLTEKASKLALAAPEIKTLILAPATTCNPETPAELPRQSGDIHTISLHDVIARGESAEKAPIDPATDAAALQYTGGTTGAPKAAILTHANLAINAQQMTSWYPALQDGCEAMLAAAPVTHVAGLGPMQNFMTSLAGELVWMSRFSPHAALDLIERHNVSVLIAPPTMYVAFLDACRERRFDWSRIRVAQAGAAPVPTELKRRVFDATGLWLTTLYGMTETSPATVYSTPLREQADATGIPLPLTEVQIRTLNNPAQIAASNESGEICVKGPQVMAGYWHRPEETQNSFVDGFFRTGDIGAMSEDGVITVRDRVKDVIIASGYNVYAADVEAAILEHPEVREAAVIGINDDYRGETVKAIISLSADAALDLPTLQTFLKGRLSPIEMPKKLEIMDDIPKNENMKISKLALRERETSLNAQVRQSRTVPLT